MVPSSQHRPPPTFQHNYASSTSSSSSSPSLLHIFKMTSTPLDYRFFDISTVWGASQPIRAGIDVHLSMYKDEIELSAVYNTRFHDGEIVEVFLQEIHRHVFRGLRLGKGLELRTTR